MTAHGASTPRAHRASADPVGLARDQRVAFSVVAGLNTALWVLILFVGMLAP